MCFSERQLILYTMHILLGETEMIKAEEVGGGKMREKLREQQGRGRRKMEQDAISIQRFTLQIIQA